VTIPTKNVIILYSASDAPQLSDTSDARGLSATSALLARQIAVVVRFVIFCAKSSKAESGETYTMHGCSYSSATDSPCCRASVKCESAAWVTWVDLHKPA
jgi:hypothetical protein